MQPSALTGTPSHRGNRGRARSALAVALLVGLSACTEATPYGRCIGLNQQPRADRTYAYSARNIALGIIGFELVYPPIKVALDEAKCPVGIAAHAGSVGGAQ